MNDMMISNIDLIKNMETLKEAASNSLSEKQPEHPGVSFKDYFQTAIHSVDNDQKLTQKLKTAYVMEDPSVSLSQVMIQMQKSEVSLSALVAVRNKLVEGYQKLLSITL